MSPPEIWGPPIWTLFHTLIEKINPNAYPFVIGSMFNMIVRICKFLPCPECSKDATNFLAKINLSDYKTKLEFKNMFYLFHNWVNSKKRKPLFNYGNINQYANRNLILVINNFISKYNTKGNMNLLTDSFNRGFVIRDFIAWFRGNSRAFVDPPLTTPLLVVEPVVLIEDIVPKVEDIVSNIEDIVSKIEDIVVEDIVPVIVIENIVSKIEDIVVEDIVSKIEDIVPVIVIEDVVSKIENIVSKIEDIVVENIVPKVDEEKPDFLEKAPILQKSKKKGKGKSIK